jgi:hypothetical protein
MLDTAMHTIGSRPEAPATPTSPTDRPGRLPIGNNPHADDLIGPKQEDPHAPHLPANRPRIDINIPRPGR